MWIVECWDGSSQITTTYEEAVAIAYRLSQESTFPVKIYPAPIPGKME